MHAPAGHAVPMAVAAAHDASQAVLPPRPTGPSYAAAPTTSGWRSWPVLVIILATVAIIVAVVLMVWPTHGGHGELDGKHSLAPPPAPERMQTEPDIQQPPPHAPDRQPPPVPPQAGATRDPSSDPADPALPDPSANAADDSTDDFQDLDRLQDPFATPRAPPVPAGRHRLNTNNRGMVMLAMAEHMCRKMLQCSADDPTVRSTCDGFARRPSAPLVGCPAADRCLQRIDTMTCGSQSDDFLQLNALMTQFRDCADAVRC